MSVQEGSVAWDRVFSVTCPVMMSLECVHYQQRALHNGCRCDADTLFNLRMLNKVTVYDFVCRRVLGLQSVSDNMMIKVSYNRVLLCMHFGWSLLTSLVVCSFHGCVLACSETGMSACRSFLIQLAACWLLWQISCKVSTAQYTCIVFST